MSERLKVPHARSRVERLRDTLGLARFSAEASVEIARELVANRGIAEDPPQRPWSLKGKTALVTGGTSGIGRATAEQFARAGAHVILLGRDTSRALTAKNEIQKAVPGAQVETVLADLSDPASVKAALKTLHEVPLDVVVNNAGGARIHREEAHGIEANFATNYLGHFQLTLGLLDQLAPQARIINITSGLHRRAHLPVDEFAHPQHYSATQAYAQSKLAQVMFTKELARRLNGSGVTVMSMDPGPVKTLIMSKEDIPFSGTIQSAMTLAGPLFREPTEVANALVHLAADPSIQNHSGEYFELTQPANASPEACDKAQAQALWVESLSLLHMEDPLSRAHRNPLGNR